MSDLLEILNPVGNNLQNDEEDVLKVKKEMAGRDYYKREPENGIIDSDLTGAIKSFQKDYSLKVDGIMKPLGETVKTINDLWGSNKSRSNQPDISLIKSRKQAVLGNGAADFSINSDGSYKGDMPLHEIPRYEELSGNIASVEKQAKLHGVDPDLMKSIIYLETTHGAYDRPFLKPSSIRPMNIRANFWKELGYSYDDLDNIDKNIEAGAKLIKGIQDASGIKDVDKLGELYHQLGATKVGNYGARIKRIYHEKPWGKY